MWVRCNQFQDNAQWEVILLWCGSCFNSLKDSIQLHKSIVPLTPGLCVMSQKPTE